MWINLALNVLNHIVIIASSLSDVLLSADVTIFFYFLVQRISTFLHRLCAPLPWKLQPLAV